MAGGGSNKATVQKVARLPVVDSGPIGAKTKGTLAERRKSRTGGASGTILADALKELVGSKGFLGA